jgi:hypothetical protein
VIELREQLANEYDSIRVNSESDSKEIDERELQYEKQCEQRI